MKHIGLAAVLALSASFAALAEDDLEAVYQSLIPKASACSSAKLESPKAAVCQASCDEAVVNLRMLVMGIPQPLSDEMKKQVAKCKADYAAFAGPSDDAKPVAKNTPSAEPAAVQAAKSDKPAAQGAVAQETDAQKGDDPYAAKKAELAALSKACSEGKPSRHSKICVKFCDQAISDLGKIGTGDANIDQAFKNAKGDVEQLASLRQCRLRHKMTVR